MLTVFEEAYLMSIFSTIGGITNGASDFFGAILFSIFDADALDE